ncbi:MAG: disulfide bond formation protein B [Acidimicrobiales bacterium]|nr:disulfide bond formation protein B [Acidimicrobiales bacterium]
MAGVYWDVREQVQPFALWAAWAVGLTATLGSLYFSEVANYAPCTLCWYQRIAMYPMAVILLVAAIGRDWRVRRYVLPVVAIGAAVSVYHWLIERFPSLDSGVCSATLPCTLIWFEKLGFVTLAYMALSGFALIAVLVVWARPVDDVFGEELDELELTEADPDPTDDRPAALSAPRGPEEHR